MARDMLFDEPFGGVVSQAEDVNYDGRSVGDMLDNGAYIGESRTAVDHLPINADLLGGKYSASDIDQINTNLKEIYKDMYIPNVKRYTVSENIKATSNTEVSISFDEPIDLSKTTINVESAFYDGGVGSRQSHYLYSADIVSVSSSGCVVSLRNGAPTTSAVKVSAIIEVVEYKKPTE